MRIRLALAAAALAACGEARSPEPPPLRDTIPVADSPAAAERAAPGDTPAPGDTAWTVGVVDRAPGDDGMATVVSLRAAGHAGYDRVVWELAGPLPGVHAEYVDRPVRQCGSGEPVALPGDAWLEVRLEPARAHTDAGRPTIADVRRAVGLPVVEEVVRTCDFEAVVTWVLAVSSPEPFRVARLADPPRVVVDVRRRSP